VILAAVSLDHEGPIERVPDPCVEVLSTNRTYDRLTKRQVHAASGVREYWVVEPEGVVERWFGQGLNRVAELDVTPLLPDFELDLPELFRA